MVKDIVTYLFCRIFDEMTECLAPILPNCNMELKLVVQIADQGMDYVCHKHFNGEDFITNDCCFLLSNNRPFSLAKSRGEFQKNVIQINYTNVSFKAVIGNFQHEQSRGNKI